MAGQGIDPGPRQAAWIVKLRDGSEYIFRKCPGCGEFRPEPSHSVIRVKDEQFSEWYRIGERGREWDLGFPLSAVGIVMSMGVTFGAGLTLFPEGREDNRTLLAIILACMVAGAITYLLTTHQMFRYNRKVRAGRREKKFEFLKELTELDPDQVGVPELIGRRQIAAVLIPEGIYDELSYIDDKE